MEKLELVSYFNNVETTREHNGLNAYLCELGLTISQKTVDKKSNEIPAMRELLELIDIHGCMVVADALHCQTETARCRCTPKMNKYLFKQNTHLRWTNELTQHPTKLYNYFEGGSAFARTPFQRRK